MRSRPTTTTPEVIEQNVWDMVIDWLASGVDPSQADAVHPVARSRARRAAPAALDDHAAGLAGARADLQGSAGEAVRPRSVDLRLSRLSAAAGRRHPDLPRDPGAGGRGPGAAHRVHARGRAPLQPHLRARAGLRGQGARQPRRSWAPSAASSTASCAHATRSRATPRRWQLAARSSTRRRTCPWATANACSATSRAAAR